MRLTVIVAPLAAVLLAACSGAKHPTAVTSPSVDASPTASASPSASAAPTATPTPSPTASPTASPTPVGTPSCTDGDVRLTVGQGQHTAGSNHQPLVVVPSRTCQLEGVPSVVAMDSLGNVIAGPAVAAGGRATPVVLLAGQSGYALLNIADADAYPLSSCVPRDAARIRVTLPGGGAPITADDAIRVCTRSGSGQLHVEPFRAGNGG